MVHSPELCVTVSFGLQQDQGRGAHLVASALPLLIGPFASRITRQKHVASALADLVTRLMPYGLL